MQTVNELFPATEPAPVRGYHGYYYLQGEFKPITWLVIAGGMKQMHFIVEYRRGGDLIDLIVKFKPLIIETGEESSLHLDRRFSVEALEKLEDPRQPVMNLIRQVAEHEILESLRVLNRPETNPDRARFMSRAYFKEVDALHGNYAEKDKLEARLASEPANCPQKKAKPAPEPTKEETQDERLRRFLATGQFLPGDRAGRAARFFAETSFALLSKAFRDFRDRQTDQFVASQKHKFSEDIPFVDTAPRTQVSIKLPDVPTMILHITKSRATVPTAVESHTQIKFPVFREASIDFATRTIIDYARQRQRHHDRHAALP